MAAMATQDSKITDEVMAQLRATHPDAKLRPMVTPMADGTEVEWVMKYPPAPAAYGAFREKSMESSAAEKASAPRILFNDMVVFPAGAELKATIKEWPGFVDTAAGECAEMAGLVRGTRQAK